MTRSRQQFRFVSLLAVIALAAAACGSAAKIQQATPSAYAPPTVDATPAPPDTPEPSPSAPATEAQANFLASMSSRYDGCNQNQAPGGTLIADVICSTSDGVVVEGGQYTTSAAVTDAFKAQSGAKKGTRCSAGAYLGSYNVGGKATGQLGCNGTATTIAWTVPKLHLYLSATTDLSMPELYAWWKDHWTVGSVASAATTGERAVPVPVAVVDTPAPVDEPAPTEPPTPTETPAGSGWNLTASHVLYSTDSYVGGPITITMTLTNSGSSASPGTSLQFSDLDGHADIQGCEPSCDITNLLGVYASLPGVRPGKTLKVTVTWIATKVGVARWSLGIYDSTEVDRQLVWYGNGVTTITQ